MDELRKIVRVLKKVDPEAPHDVVLVLDATTGQNAHNQVEVFKDMVDLTGLIVTKLDGTAKGGVVVALARRFGLPIHAIGVGETIEDLRPFEAPPSRAPCSGWSPPRAAENQRGRGRCPATLSRRCSAPSCSRWPWASCLGLRPQRRGRPGRLHAARQVRPGRRARHRRRRADLRHQGRPGAGPGARPGQTYRAQVTFSVRNGIELPADSSAAIVSSGPARRQVPVAGAGRRREAAGGRRGDHAHPVLGQSRGPDRPLHLQRPERPGQRGRGGPATVRALRPRPGAALTLPAAAARAGRTGAAAPGGDAAGARQDHRADDHAAAADGRDRRLSARCASRPAPA